jgi:UDP-N-acetylglucosamine 2-epimerase (non-hydrolysing)
MLPGEHCGSKNIARGGRAAQFHEDCSHYRGARPEGGKNGRNERIRQILLHTGQHYDHRMSTLFFGQLGLPRLEINLEIGSGFHGQQTGRNMEAFENVLVSERPDLVVVVGDVNSTMACANDAKKLGIVVVHVEAGLRSGDMTMPEEINRIVTDAIADQLFTTDRSANANLRAEGRKNADIIFVGNVMIDTLLKYRERAMELNTLEVLGIRAKGHGSAEYAVVTLHRPGNVDDKGTMASIVTALQEIGRQMPVIFPVHRRTRTRLSEFGMAGLFSEKHGIRLVDPMGYLELLNLTGNARVVLTDSGGIQEETTILGVPCLTLRPNTERPITITEGTNQLVGNDSAKIIAAFERIVAVPREVKTERQPKLWDGKAGERIAEIIAARFDR